MVQSKQLESLKKIHTEQTEKLINDIDKVCYPVIVTVVVYFNPKNL